MRIAPDGQILSVNGVTFSGSAQASGVDYPGTDQMTAILADGPVEPGDSWQKTFSQESPLGQGKLQYTAKSTFERYDYIHGVKTAVIVTTLSVGYDLTVDLGKVTKAFARGAAQSPAVARLSHIKVAYRGSGTFTDTSWIGMAHSELIKSSGTGDFDVRMKLSGPSGSLPPGDAAVAVVRRLDRAGSGSARSRIRRG